MIDASINSVNLKQENQSLCLNFLNNTSSNRMKHEEQLKVGSTTTLDEPISETIVSKFLYE